MHVFPDGKYGISKVNRVKQKIKKKTTMWREMSTPCRVESAKEQPCLTVWLKEDGVVHFSFEPDCEAGSGMKPGPGTSTDFLFSQANISC